MGKPQKKHDKIAKLFLEDPEIAYEFLSLYLPKDILSKCDLSKISVEPGSYIEENLKDRASDIVYKIDLYDKSEADAVYLYVLIEHQSKADKLMPLRITHYQLAIIQKHLDKYKSSKVKLPLVIPLVLYNGRQSPYPYLCNMQELFADQELYMKMPLGTFKLIDLTVKADNEILTHGKLSILEIVTKHIHDRDFIKVVHLVIEALTVAHNENVSQSLINGIFSYLMYAKEKKEIMYLLDQVGQKTQYYKGNTMSYAEELLKQGREEGRREAETYAEELLRQGREEGRREVETYTEELLRQGREEAMQKGVHQAQQEIAKNLLESGIDEQVVAIATHLSFKEIKDLKKNIH